MRILYILKHLKFGIYITYINILTICKLLIERKLYKNWTKYTFVFSKSPQIWYIYNVKISLVC